MRLRIGFAYDNDQPGVVVDNPDELDAVLDQVQRRSLELDQPIIAIRATEEPPVRGKASVEVGVNQDHGYIYYTAPLTDKRPRDAWRSRGQRTGPAVAYAYQRDSYTGEVPAQDEIPFDVIRRAVREFMETGERPTSIEWAEN